MIERERGVIKSEIERVREEGEKVGGGRQGM